MQHIDISLWTAIKAGFGFTLGAALLPVVAALVTAGIVHLRTLYTEDLENNDGE